MSEMYTSERYLLKGLSDWIYNGTPTKQFIEQLQLLSLRSQNYQHNGVSINTLPNEILMLVFDYVGIYKPLVKQVCHRWFILLYKFRITRKVIPRYNITTINYLFSFLHVSKQISFSVIGYIRKDYEDFVIYLMRKTYYRHNTTSQYQSKMCAEAIYHNCERIAKELFNKSIRIKKSHFISAINNGNYEMVL
jgi:hypothetical protein